MTLLRVLLLATTLWTAPLLAQDSPTVAWPSWRGPLATGFAPGADPPVHWSEQENLRWKTALPGLGHSTPVVSGGRVFVTCAVEVGDAFEPAPDRMPGAHDNTPVTRARSLEVLALALDDGEVLWRTELSRGVPQDRAHKSASFASASPVTDGRFVAAFFGSHGLFVLDVEGELVWSKDLGDMDVKHSHGEGSSPALADGRLIINWDHEGQSFLAAFELEDGEELWREKRDEVTSWASPIVVRHGDRSQVIVSGTNAVRGYDLTSGQELWKCGGLSHNVVATPVSDGEMLWAASSYERQALLAIRLEGAQGDLRETDNLVWYRRKSTPYVPSPLLMDGSLYFLRHYQGFLERVEASSGKQSQRGLRLPGLNDIYASPLGAANRLYILDRSGQCAVLSHGEDPVELARNSLEDRFSASPVAIGRDLLLRGEHHLYCLRQEESGAEREQDER